MRHRLIPLALIVAGLPSMALAQEASPKRDAPPAQKPTGPDAKAPAKPDSKSSKDKTVGEVVVNGQVTQVQSSIDRKSYSLATDLQAQSGGSVADSLRNVPSVEVDVQGNVSLRGDSSVTILVDGKPSSLFEGDNKGQALQSMPADSIERVEVITNPSAEFSANGTAGVINLITKKSRGAGTTGSFRLTAGDGRRGVASLSGGYNSPKLNLTGEIGARQDSGRIEVEDDRLLRPSTAQPFQQIDQHQINQLLSDTVYGRASVDYDLTERTRIGAEGHFNYTFFRVDNPTRYALDDTNGVLDSFTRQNSIHQKRATGGVSVNWRQKVGKDGEFTTSVSAEQIDDPRVRFGHDFDFTPPAADTFDIQRLNYHVHHDELKGDLVQPFADASKLKAGFDIDFVDNSYRNRGFQGPSETALAPDLALTNLFKFRQTVSAAYVTYEKPIGALTLLGGLRVEDVRLRLDQATLGQVDHSNYLRLYPTLHLGWKLSDDQTLTASVSRRVYRPDALQFNGFRMELDPLDFQSGNPHLKPQRTDSFELGYERHFGGTFLVATLFYRENSDGVLPVLTALGDGVSLTRPQNEARIQYPGLEVTVSGKLTPSLSYNLSATVNWKHLDDLGPQFAPARSLLSESSHGNVTWQATAKDLFQLNYFSYQKGLTPQGTLSPVMGFDLGYRRKISDKVFVLVTLQDFLHSFHALTVNRTPLLIENVKTDFDTRAIRVGFTWALGGGKPKDPSFEFQNGGGAGPTP